MRRLAALILHLGCGQGDLVKQDAGPMDPWYVPPDAAPVPEPVLPNDAGTTRAEFASRYCALLGACCAEPIRCEVQLGQETPIFKPATADECLAALASASASPSFCTDGFNAASSVCQEVFIAQVATQRLGQPCAATEQCLTSPQGYVRCAGPMGMARCQVLLRGKEGSTPCVATASGPLTVPAGASEGNGIQGYLCHVADNLWCDDQGARCAPVKRAGEPCTSFGECGAFLYCDDAGGKCAARKREGAACAVDEECPSTICGEDNRCAPAPRLHPAIAKLCTTP